jgi:hypothetical protein
MKSAALLTGLLSLICTGDAVAQTFLNGSFEAPSTPPCTNIYNFQFTTFMANTGYAFGTIVTGGNAGKIFFYDGSCGEGSAQKGNDFLGLGANDAGMVDAMSLTLTAPLVVNKTYTLSFYYKKPKTMPTIGLELGYTTDSLAFGTRVATVQAPATTNWVLQTFNFHATVSTKYITMRTVQSHTGTFAYSYTLLDNFSIAPATAVAPEATAFSTAPHPNPFTTSLGFSIDEKAAMPCSITLCDMTGRVVYEQSASGRNLQIPRGNISAGIYLLTVRDADGAATFSRITAE